ncbi:hypothetical protein N0V95_003649 [Ascochyta clinopodiicola]|nr:hypothetical protein N0V95_003649 [Ascochyta clinopodiicola]
MSDFKIPEVSTAAPEAIINRDVAAKERQKSSGIVARGNVVHLRDDPEAKAAFLSTFTADDEKRIMRKVDMRFVFLAGVMYLIKQIDQNNATNVRVLHVGQPSNIMVELGMTSNQYNWVGSIYGIAYIIFEAPSNLLLKKLAPHNWQARIFLTWGIITACHAAARNRHDLYAMRFLLGMFEAEREQEFIETRLPESAPMTSDPDFSGKEIKGVLSEWLIWSFMLSQTLVNLGGYALTWYLPTVITNLGFVGLPRNQLLLLPPFGAAVCGLLFSAWFMERAWIVRPAYIMFILSGMVVCFVLFFTISDRTGIFIACVLGNLFYQSYFSPFWAWRSATLVGSTAVLASLSSIGTSIDADLRTRTADLHANSAAIAKQEKELAKQTAALKKESDKWQKLGDTSTKKLNEIGDVQNWAEMLERDLLVLEETLRLADNDKAGGVSREA